MSSVVQWRDGKEISSNVAGDQPDGPVTRGTLSLR
jgi:hypothetical protein